MQFADKFQQPFHALVAREFGYPSCITLALSVP